MDITTMFDGMAKVQDEGIWVDIKLGTEVTDFRIRVCGPDSERAKQARHDVFNAAARRGKLLRQQPASIIEADRIKEIAGCICGWEGMTHNGEPVPFTKARAVELLTKYRAIYQQVEKVACSRDAFMPAWRERKASNV